MSQQAVTLKILSAAMPRGKHAVNF